MELTLFGVIESKTESKKRAERISLLISRIDDAPDERKCIRSHYFMSKDFIDKAKARKLDPNDYDGLQRTVGDLSDMLTEKDRAQMESNTKIWKHYTGKWAGWAGALPRHRFCTTLHPKEIAYLEDIRKDQISMMVELRHALSDYRRELAQLRAVADIPEDIAKRYQLTPKGFRTRKAKE